MSLNKSHQVIRVRVKNPKAFIDYSQTIDDDYKNGLTKRRKVLIVFQYMIEDIEANKRLKLIVAEIREKGLVHKRKKNKHFCCFCLYYNLILKSLKLLN